MPIYDYRCSACDHLAELLLGRNDPAPQFCPSCGAEGTMRKAFTAPTILFKGSGWAKKDRATAARSAGSKTDPTKDGGEGGGSSKDASDGKASDGKTADPKSPAPASSDAKSSASGTADGSSKSGASGGSNSSSTKERS